MDEAAEVDLAVRIRLQVVHTWRLGEVHTCRGTNLDLGTHLERYILGDSSMERYRFGVHLERHTF